MRDLSCGHECSVRALHVLVSLAAAAGGPAAAVQGLTTALRGHGVKCEIATTTGGRAKGNALPTPGIPVHSFPVSAKAGVWNGHSPLLARFLASNVSRFDVIHVHEPWHHPGFAAYRSARRSGTPSVLSIRGGFVSEALAVKPLRKRLYMRIVQGRLLDAQAAVHVLTRAEAAQVRAQGVTAPTFEAPNGIAHDLLDTVRAASPDPLLQRYPQLRGKRVILYLGRIVAHKGPELLGRCFAALSGRFPDAALLIAGPPSEPHTRHRVARYLADAGLSKRVAVAGLLTGDDKLAALALASVFVLPSRIEGFSNAIVEALAAALPVVISEQCNFPQVATADAGFVLPLQATAFEEAIATLLSDHFLRVRMGTNARRMVEEHYTWPIVAKSFAELYRQVAHTRQIK